MAVNVDTCSIIHHDSRVIVLNKPSGLLSVPGKGPLLKDCLARRVQKQCPTALIVHRLDRDTSGLIVMALDPQAQRSLSRQFETRTVEKRYECIVEGHPEADEGMIDLPIARDSLRPPRYCIHDLFGRPSQTHWQVLERYATSTRIAVRPITGRSHQIRLHLATLGHAILGDPLYACATIQTAATRLLLHATFLQVHHPDDERKIAWQTPCPF